MLHHRKAAGEDTSKISVWSSIKNIKAEEKKGRMTKAFGFVVDICNAMVG